MAFFSGKPKIRVLMVCMGNICRSPTAEGVLRSKLAQVGLADRVEVDSAGTHAFHVGGAPDVRAQKHAQLRGYDLSALRAREVNERDFEQFDLIVAMDWANLSSLDARCPNDPPTQRKLRRLTEFVPAQSPHAGAEVVPDPYYGGPAGFEFVLDLVESACDGLVVHLSALDKAASAGAG
ncbi:MAG: low molecular weight protein-tyrosine-phosphatase [Aquabacterium sp.]|nr:low molecular weight protein-tyrosine-phosphatase [Aquabacterium sp.]